MMVDDWLMTAVNDWIMMVAFMMLHVGGDGFVHERFAPK